MKVFPGDALAFNLGHSYSAPQSLTAIFSASHFPLSAPLTSLARTSIYGWGLCFLLPMGCVIILPLPLNAPCWVRDFFHICSTPLAGMKGDSSSPSRGRDELHPAERGDEDEASPLSSSFSFRLWPSRLSHFSPSLPASPLFFTRFAVIDDHDALLLDSLLT